MKMAIMTMAFTILTMLAVSCVFGMESLRQYDPLYPGTAVQRMLNARTRAVSLTPRNLSTEWTIVRQKILWAAGLKDLQEVLPGQGYTGHAFNDWNHVDATCMLVSVIHNENEGKVEGIDQKNNLGRGIVAASITELGEGGTWSTCMLGCDVDPPQDVAHVQFRARIAFKLVWCPPTFSQFVLVDDNGDLLTWGQPTGQLPSLREREMNYRYVMNSKYGLHAFERSLEDLNSRRRLLEVSTNM